MSVYRISRARGGVVVGEGGVKGFAEGDNVCVDGTRKDGGSRIGGTFEAVDDFAFAVESKGFESLDAFWDTVVGRDPCRGEEGDSDGLSTIGDVAMLDAEGDSVVVYGVCVAGWDGNMSIDELIGTAIVRGNVRLGPARGDACAVRDGLPLSPDVSTIVAEGLVVSGRGSLPRGGMVVGGDGVRVAGDSEPCVGCNTVERGP